jgi:protein-S-isoprenylcysteine O-methyltransferase Ste14
MTGVLAILIFVLAPFSEEPWLIEQHGEAYDKYMKQTPRFFDIDLLIKQKGKLML